jgi:hypothetical protein
MTQPIDVIARLCQLQQDQIAKLERQLSDIQVEAEQELKRIEEHGGMAGFALRVKALAERGT